MVDQKKLQQIIEAKKVRVHELKRKRFEKIEAACQKRDNRLIEALKKKLGL